MQVAPFAIALTVLIIVLRKRGKTRGDLALVWPPPRLALLWLLGWVVFAVALGVVNRHFEGHTPDSWRDKYSPLVIAIRIVGVVFLAPIVEELIFRGLLLPRLAATRLGAIGGIAVVAGLFAALHFQAGVFGVALIFLDACFFGAARLHARSLLLPMVMHLTGNLYAAVERLI